MAKNIQKSIKKLLKANGRLEKHLFQIVSEVKERTFPKFIESVKSQIANPLDWDKFFKILILINNVIVNAQIPLEQAQSLLRLMRIKTVVASGMENVLINELLIPYQFYLQKRCLFVDFMDKDQSQAKCYSLLNLLNIGGSFSKMIFRLARYYSTILGYAEDFNIAWAADLSYVYYCMSKSLMLQKSPSFIQKFKPELEKVHESLYNVFYNCYFHKHLIEFIPKWFKTQIKAQEKQNPESPKLAIWKKQQVSTADHSEISVQVSIKRKNANQMRLDEEIMIKQFSLQEEFQAQVVLNTQEREFQQLTYLFQQLSLDIIRRGKNFQCTQ